MNHTDYQIKEDFLTYTYNNNHKRIHWESWKKDFRIQKCKWYSWYSSIFSGAYSASNGFMKKNKDVRNFIYLEFFRSFRNALDVFGRFWMLSECFGCFRNILDAFGMFWMFSEYFGCFWNTWNPKEFWLPAFRTFPLERTTLMYPMTLNQIQTLMMKTHYTR